jgi:hypothetical protein
MDLFMAAMFALAFYCYMLMFLYASDRSLVMVGGLAFLTIITGGMFSIACRAIVYEK